MRRRNTSLPSAKTHGPLQALRLDPTSHFTSPLNAIVLHTAFSLVPRKICLSRCVSSCLTLPHNIFWTESCDSQDYGKLQKCFRASFTWGDQARAA